MANKIDTVTARAKLKPRREPYWHRVSKGNYVGFRRMTAGTGGTWVARSHDTATGKQSYRSLGDLSDLPDHQRFDAASKAALVWFDHLGRGGSASVKTVADVCSDYVAHVQRNKGDAAAYDAARSLARHVLIDQRLSAIDITKLTPVHLSAWRKTLQDKPTTRGTRKGQQRTDSTLNRDMTAFRAALNHAYREGHITTDFAWRSKLAPVPGADRSRDLYLDKSQREKIIQHASPHFVPFLTALCYLPMRPGAVAALTVANYDKRLQVLTVGKDKSGSGRKLHLPDVTAQLFEDNCRDKLPSAHIFVNSWQTPWAYDAWAYQFTRAAQRAGITSDATLYSIRHSVITDLIVHGVDPLTVGKLAGTSLAMIQRHYGHLVQEHARASLAIMAS